MKLRTILPALMVLAVSLAATGISVWAQRDALLNAARSQFLIQGEALSESIEDVMTSHISVLRAGAGLFIAKGGISREEWRRFIGAMNLSNDFPGILGVGYAEVLDRSKADGGLLDQESGAAVTNIRLLEPDNWRNQRAIGYDMFSETVRRRAMERARDTAMASLSEKVTLVQEENEAVQPGVLLYVPVYSEDLASESVADRRRHLRGFVFGAFRLGDLMTLSLVRKNPEAFYNINLQIYDGSTPTAASMLFDSGVPENERQQSGAQAGSAPLFSSAIPLMVSGRPWLVQVRSNQQFESRIDWNRLNIQMVGGIIISILMAAIVAGLGIARERSQQTAMELAAEIEDRRKAQEQAQLANRELIHRVKNTLAIVNAIASQTARHTRNMTEFTSAFRERLGSLGRVHDLLRPDRSGNPDFREILTATLAPYKPNNASALTLEGPSTSVARDDAVLLSLFINELATNAIKYGAWSAAGGNVAIAWQLNEDGKQLTIRWTESHGPQVVPPQRVGFGTNVMKFAVERSMDGTVSLTYPEAGVEHEIKIPWGKAVDSHAPYGQIANKAT